MAECAKRRDRRDVFFGRTEKVEKSEIELVLSLWSLTL